MGWNGEPHIGVGEKPHCLIGHPFHPDFHKVINVLTAHAVSHERLDNNHEICLQTIWTQPGTEDFLVRSERKGSQRKAGFAADLDPDG